MGFEPTTELNDHFNIQNAGARYAYDGKYVPG